MSDKVLFTVTIEKDLFRNSVEKVLFLDDGVFREEIVSLFQDTFIPRIDLKYQQGAQRFLEILRNMDVESFSLLQSAMSVNLAQSRTWDLDNVYILVVDTDDPVRPVGCFIDKSE